MAEVTEQEAREALAKIEQDVDSGKTPNVIDLIFAASYLKSELARRDANREPFTMQSPPANLDAVVRQPAPPDASGKASECKWVVGQWVESWGRTWRIIETGQTRSNLDGNGEPSWWCNHGEMNPFEWQVGKRYKTTIDGVTATIDESYTSSVVCKLSNGIGRLIFNNRTGKPLGCERVEGVPHLLPYLADEQSTTPPDVPPVEHPSSKIERAAQKALEKLDGLPNAQSELLKKVNLESLEKSLGETAEEWPDEDDSWAAIDRSVQRDTLQQLTDVQANLADYRDVCQRLWPFVRYFIIAGACPEAINCVVDLGRLLGHTEASKSTIVEIGERVRAETLDDVAARLESLLRGKVLSKHMPEVLDAVRKM